MEKLLILLMLVISIVTKAQNKEIADIYLNEIVKKYNNFSISETPYTADSISDNFDFECFAARKEANVGSQRFFKVFYGSNNKILRIAQYSKDVDELNFEYLVREYDDIVLMYAYKFVGCNSDSKAIEHKCGEIINGFFVQDKQTKYLYFIGTVMSKEAQPTLKVEDIYCIMKLNKELQAISKINFFKGYLTQRTDFLFDKKLKEKAYCYSYPKKDKDEECSKYNKIGKLTIKRVNHLFREPYHCSVTLEATIIPEVPATIGEHLLVWSLNGYGYY